jgi:hypothetical protein
MIGLPHLTCDPSAWQCQCSAEVLLLRVLLERTRSHIRTKRNSLLNSLRPLSHLRTVRAALDGSQFFDDRSFRCGGLFNTHKPTCRVAV